jgi:GMP synthase (glutamine-hydrolysing)
MRILALIHHEVAGSGVFGDEVRRRGHAVDEWVASAQPMPRPLPKYDAVMAFGGGMQADQEQRYPWLRSALGVLDEALRDAVPTLGVCLGAQMLARAAGGSVGPSPEAEWGWQPVSLTDDGLRDPLFTGLPRTFDVFQWHSYAFELPPGAVPLASSPVCLQAFRAGDCAWGVQWHPEVTGESVLHWAKRYPPAPHGVPVEVDLPALRNAIGSRMATTNDAGRPLPRRGRSATLNVVG